MVRDQVKQLQQQLQQAQSAGAELSSTKTQLILLQSQLHQQRELCQHQSVAAEGLTAGLEQERNSWQAEHQSLSTRAQVQQQYIHNAALQWGQLFLVNLGHLFALGEVQLRRVTATADVSHPTLLYDIYSLL